MKLDRNGVATLKSTWHPLKRGLFTAVIILIAAFFIGHWWDTLSQAQPTFSPPPLKGMALGIFHQDSNFNYQADLQEIKKLGANAVLLMVPWYQQDIRSNKISPQYKTFGGNKTTTDVNLVRMIEQAQQLELKVLLMPYLRFETRATKEWRGVLKPQNFDAWATQYEKFILHYAKLAQAQGIEIFSIGSELGSTEENEVFWNNIIKKVKMEYKGKLVYSANWDHYHHPKFWNQLDYIGITSYHRLTETLPPSLKALRKNLKKIQSDILEFVKKYPGKQLIITEVGYPSLQGASKDPWNYFLTTPLDTSEQALCYQAFIETWNDTPHLEGVFWWVWFGEGGPEDKSYTPKGKPAARELVKWYGGSQEKI